MRRALLALFILLALATPASGDTDPLALINAERSSNGLTALQPDANLNAYALQHSAEMAAAGDLYHSTSAQLQNAAEAGWTQLGENVGHGQTIKTLHAAFLASPGHRANILGPYSRAGTGSAVAADGTLYTTAIFAAYPEAATTTTTATTAAPTAPTATTQPEPRPEATQPTQPRPSPLAAFYALLHDIIERIIKLIEAIL